MRCDLPCRRAVALVLGLLLPLSLLTPACADWIISDTQSYTSPDTLPSFTGDIQVLEGGSLSLTGYDLTLPANVVVTGQLTLSECTLRLPPKFPDEKGLWVYGAINATGTHFSNAVLGQMAYLLARGASVNTFADCRFDDVHVQLWEQSSNVISNCWFASDLGSGWPRVHFAGDSYTTVTDTTFCTIQVAFYERSTNTVTRCAFSSWGAYSADNSHTTFTECVVPHFELCSPASSVLDTCTGLVNVGLVAYDGTVLHVSDLAPGYQTATVIQADTSAYRLELRDTDVPAFDLAAVGNAVLAVDRCELHSVESDYGSRTTLTDSTVDVLGVRSNWPAGSLAPANLTVRGFRDGDAPQTLDIVSEGGPLELHLRNTTVGHSLWSFGDNGYPPAASHVTIEDSELGDVFVFDTSVVEARRSTLERAGVHHGTYVPQSSAQFTAEDSLLCRLELLGSDTRFILRRSQLAGPLIAWTDWAPPAAAPELVLEAATFAPAADTSVHIEADVVGARIVGEGLIDPTYYVYDWAPDSTVLRQFPVQVLDELGAPVAGAAVTLGPGGWRGATDAQGYAYPEVWFTDHSYGAEYRVFASVPGRQASAPLTFLSSTPVLLTLANETVSCTGFEPAPSQPWRSFVSGPGPAYVWPARGNTLGPHGLVPAAHSGVNLRAADLLGQATAGLRLDLPAEPSGPASPLGYDLRAWTYLRDRTEGDTSSFFGFALSDGYPGSAHPWAQTLGWEALSSSESRLRVGADTIPLVCGLTPGRWHLVELKYDRELKTLQFVLDGLLVEEVDVSTLGGGPAHWALLGAAGSEPGAQEYLAFDDISLRLRWPQAEGGGDRIAHPCAQVGTFGTIIIGEPWPYDGGQHSITWGNGYPVLGSRNLPAPEPQRMYVAADFPPELAFGASVPPPGVRYDNTVIWQWPVPDDSAFAGTLVMTCTPTGPALPKITVWATADPSALLYGPPRPADPADPFDPVWGYPQDVSSVYPLTPDQNTPDLWVTKEGPTSASPGDAVGYLLTVGNQSLQRATHLVVRDQLPPEMGGGNLIVANVEGMGPGGWDRWLVTGRLAWGLPEGSLVTNHVYVTSSPTGVPEANLDNNTDDWTLTVHAAHDPNHISVSPEGGVERGEALTYTLECENVGLGTAYGVYAAAELDSRLDDTTLTLPTGLSYDPISRALLWEVGTLGPSEGASASFTAEVASDAKRARPIIGHATVYFPSVPEETLTNVVANIVKGSFPDITWNHWAVLPIEQAKDYGVVGGYPDGNYYPLVTVTRDQMAAFIARTMAGGDAHVPEGTSVATFPDVAVGTWAYKYVEYAVAHHIVGGYPDGQYHSDIAVDRGQMAVFIARALLGGDGAVPDGPPTPTFPDVTPTSPAAWCRKHVEYTVSKGVVGGYPDGNYHPEITVTRDQMAVFIARAFEFPG